MAEILNNNNIDYPDSENNPRFPHHVKMVRDEIDTKGNPFLVNPTETLLYDGACRSYNKGATKYKGGFMYNSRRISIKGGLLGLQKGDRVFVDMYGYKEEGYVVDVKVYMNGRGTTIEWDYERT